MKLLCALIFAVAVLPGAEDDAARLLGQAQADLAAGRYAATIQEASRTAAELHSRGDRRGEGRALTVIGLAHLYSGNYAKALDTFTRALEIAREIHDGEGELTRLNNIGTAFYFQGRYGDAMARYQEALRRVDTYPHETWTQSRRQLTIANIAILYQTLGQYERALDLYLELLHSRQALPIREQAQLLSNVGSLRRRLGDPQKALDTYRAAQDLYRKATHRDGEIAVLNNIGIVQAMDLRDYAAASDTFSDALRLAQQSGDRPRAVHARLYRGETLYRKGDTAKSEADFQAVVDEAMALGEREETWKALYGVARIASRNGNVAKSDELLKRAAGLIESMRTGLGGSLQSDFLADKRDVYDLLIEHARNVGDMFAWMERSRARNLQDRLRPSAIPELKALAAALPDDTAVLEYWMGSSEGAVLWVSAAGTGVRRWTFSKTETDLLLSLPSMLSDPQRESWREYARAVSQEVLDDLPVLKQSRIQRLVIVPDGDLARIPFEVLPLDGAGLLVERFSVSYSPAASLLAARRPGREIRWPWQMALEAFADPAPGASSPAADLAAPRSWMRLPAAVREATGIAGIVGGRTRVYVGPEARKEYLVRNPRPAILHLATHAFADERKPDESYILLAPAAPAQRFDYLFLKEVNGLSLQGVDLVTASACETEGGRIVRGEGVQSFGRAFLAAGARSVVTSLWDVNDRATAEFMLRFYAELATGKSKDVALRNAKLQFLANANSQHPAFWAAFLLDGDSSSRIPRIVGWTWLLLPPLLLACAALLIRRLAEKA